MLINLQMRDLMYFAKVAELGHLGRASQELHITQPALSKCIDRLETTYGAALFERSGRGIRLTDAGRLLLERARMIERSLDETHRQISSLGKGLAGLVRVGAAATIAEFVMPAVCRAMLEEAPEVAVELQIGMNDVLHESLRKRLLDVVVGPLGTRDDALTEIPIATDEVVVAASASHPLAGAHASLQDMSRYGWVLPARSVATRQWLERVFLAHQLPPPHASIMTSSIAAVPRLIAQSGLLSFISRRNLTEGRFTPELVEVFNPETTMIREFGVVHLDDAYLSPATKRFIELVKAVGQMQAPGTR
ncbi:LysR family transcriptional regulator [Caballeronia insecticola]|uniref:Transcriptional regulator LysR family n=1 Tax=Caballeronia insecticola TaxID=758793 RepID=A0A060PJP0_9BURK|nr:LysR substrate-binding domain-containing protein [Caballeronia insecticola]BAO94143.1 transcriptional regulator LysR family [Caballeronia insecticola]